MPATTPPRDNRHSDPQKSDTPDKYRNQNAGRKAPDQPEHVRSRDERDPEKDYPDRPIPGPDRR